MLGTVCTEIPEFEVDTALGRQFAPEVEVGAQQATARQPDELRVRTARVARRIVATNYVEVSRNCKRVQLRNVSTRFEPLEMEATACISHGVSAILKIDANILDTLLFGKGLLAAVTLDNPADNGPGRAKQIFLEANLCCCLVRQQATTG